MAYTVSLRGRETVAENTIAIRFDKPAGFAFKAGQAVDLTLADLPADSKGPRRAFSLVSAPSESDLCIATRVRDSAFKRALASLPIGTKLELDGPFGSLVLHSRRERPAVFVAGGIGITPFISMLRQATAERLPQNILLFYSNHRPEDAAFLEELTRLEKQNGHFRLIATMTRMAHSSRSWSGITGPLTAELISKSTGRLSLPIYYVAGSSALVAGIRKMLNDAGVNDDDIRSEDFPGY